LGEIALTFADDRLILDAGEFQAELRPLKRQIPNVPNYYLFDPPISGLPVELAEDADGKPTVVLHVGTERYVFSFIDNGPLTPLASPVAAGSPEAEPSD
jgi:hypothetical protein